ncbi:MAG: hypothetical protein CVV14_00690 [Gammaproteobacteria bacterium HGW-Gammaproteobacteria-4]|nr:MAG: hypothetical protein CVV14_00690 [Gammaproteobacteria bacterium HGW-Gammaproteobacteria-4]
MSGICFEVNPLSRQRLMEITTLLRTILQIDRPFFPILEVVEFAFPRIFADFCFTVREMNEMGGNHGLTLFRPNEIRLRIDVYDGVEQRKGRDRMTLAHEVGHLLLHDAPGLARKPKNSVDIPPYKSSEWQANAFAGSLLMPIEFLKSARSLREIIDECAVTEEAAATHTRLLTQAGLLCNPCLG